MTLQLSETDLAALTGNVVSEFVAAAEHKRIRLSCRLPEHVTAKIDAGKVERVVSNILSNAVKFTPVAGEINVELVVDTPQGTATLSVTNTGRGIAEGDLPHIFERFYQPQHSEGGTGIGLALAKAFVDMHGGHIGVSSKVEGPTVFTVHLPLNVQAETPTSAADQSPIAEPQAFIVPATPATTKADAPQLQTIFEENNDPNQPTILFTDDNDDVCQMARTLLETHYRVLTAPNGVVALQMAELNIPDLVVSDVMMPQMNGLELCSRLKQSTATSHIPVILLTARTLDEQRIAGYEHGADAYITKPFSAPLLLARIHNLLQSRKQLKQVFGGADELAKEEISTPDKEFVSKIRSEIHRNISNNDFGVEQLGAAVDLSRVQLYRKVKALTGLSPVELIRATRVNRARKLIEGGATSVSEVAYQVGFTSPSYFTKCFKDQFGVSPMELLK